MSYGDVRGVANVGAIQGGFGGSSMTITRKNSLFAGSDAGARIGRSPIP